MRLRTLCDRLDDRLDTGAYADVDASANGLQVGPGDAKVTEVAFAVDAASETFRRAAEAGADVLVTHHGISWGGFERVSGRTYDHVSTLVDNDIALYVSHLPLDGHQELGNAAALADLLGLADREPFGEMGPVHVGQRGRAEDPYDLDVLADLLAEELPTDGREVRTLPFGPETVEDVAIVTGSGVDWLDEAAAVGADVLVTGEGKQQVYHEAKEAGINVVLGGHYATETGGVRALQDVVSGWGLDTTYFEVPTGL